MSTRKPKSVSFRAEREQTWLELEDIVKKIESGGIGAASADELGRLPHLYNATLSSLSVARTISLDRNLLRYLEGLCSRAFLVVYSTRRRPWHVIAQFFQRDFPREVYRLRRHLATATAVFLMGVLVANHMVMEEPEVFHTFVDAAYAQGRGPESTTESLRAVLFSGSSFKADDLGQFASFLMTHNSKIGMMCFVLGFAVGIPVLYLLFQNGAVLGAFSGLYISRGLGVEFYSWILPHGITEILAVLLCGAAGLYIGEAIVFPGQHTRARNLAIRGRQAGVVVVGAVMLFFMAGLIEGFFRQIVMDLNIRFTLAFFTGMLWLTYLGLYSRQLVREEGR